jgi:hypothetical protein
MRRLVPVIVPALLLAACAGTPPAGQQRTSAAYSASTGSHIAGAETTSVSTTDTSQMTNRNVGGSTLGSH